MVDTEAIGPELEPLAFDAPTSSTTSDTAALER